MGGSWAALFRLMRSFRLAVMPLLLTAWVSGDTIIMRLGERIRPLPIADSSLPYTGGVCEAAI
jgi:hypothetical protein